MGKVETQYRINMAIEWKGYPHCHSTGQDTPEAIDTILDTEKLKTNL